MVSHCRILFRGFCRTDRLLNGQLARLLCRGGSWAYHTAKTVRTCPVFCLKCCNLSLSCPEKGEKKQDSANEILLTAIFFIVIAAIISSIAFVFFASAIIGFCGSTADTHNDAVVYFRIIMGGMIFNCIQMGINAAQRGAGNTKITMRTNVTSNTINILLNYLLINGRFGFPALGIRGAALATISGTVVACIMSVASIFKKESF